MSIDQNTSVHIDLHRLGWNQRLEKLFAPFKLMGFEPARVVREERGAYLVCGDQGEISAEVTGRLLHHARVVSGHRHEVSDDETPDKPARHVHLRSDLPAVGDWVGIQVPRHRRQGRIHTILPRTSCFSRQVAGAVTEQQIAATNVDTAFLVCGLDEDFNLRRIERYLLLAYSSGARPVIVLNKSDLCENVADKAAQVQAIAPSVPVHPVSATGLRGLEDLLAYLPLGHTAVLVGSSGVGKSSLINAWLGSAQLKVGTVSADGHGGKHTTTHRELIMLPQGGVVIDTPGVRELQLWALEETLATGFDDIAALKLNCKFRNCLHISEPGCAVKGAIADGTLSAGRLESHRKLGGELAALANRQTQQFRGRGQRSGKAFRGRRKRP